MPHNLCYLISKDSTLLLSARTNMSIETGLIYRKRAEILLYIALLEDNRRAQYREHVIRI
jgi:hypothetical protein